MKRFARQTIVELRRALDTRAPRWAFAATLLGGLGVGLLVPGGARGTFAVFMSGVALGLPILIGLLAVMTFTADWSTRAALTTFLITPSRQRVLAARYLSVLLLAVGSVTVLHVVGAGIYAVVGGDLGSVIAPAARQQFWSITGTTVATAATATAVAGLVLRTALALVLAVFLPFALTLALAAVPAVLEWANPYGFAGWIADPMWQWSVGGGDRVGIGPALTSFVLWTAIPLALGWFRQLRAEPQ